MRSELYTMVINDEYDYENEAITTDNKEVAKMWLQAGVKEIAILDALSYEYLGYMDESDLDNMTVDDYEVDNSDFIDMMEDYRRYSTWEI